MPLQARLVNVQHFCVDDGPGLRTTVFLKGCNLRCIWCHNPESQSREKELFFYPGKCIRCGNCRSVCPNSQLFSHDCLCCGKCAENCYAEAITLCGTDVSEDELFAQIMEDQDIYVRSGGGVTFSGGEPILQSDFLLPLLKRCKAAGIHTAIETAGCYDYQRIEPLLPYIDLIFCDIKSLNPDKHKLYTGVSNEKILANIHRFAKDANRLVIRVPVAVGFNADEIEAIAAFTASLSPQPEVELLPFHSMCSSKYQALRRSFGAQDFQTPTQEQICTYRAFFKEENR